MAELKKAVANLKKGKGSIFSICGGAGTGKSRIVEELKSTLNLNEIQWIEGHAYPYAQFIPYFPLIDLLLVRLMLSISLSEKDSNSCIIC